MDNLEPELIDEYPPSGLVLVEHPDRHQLTVRQIVGSSLVPANPNADTLDLSAQLFGLVYGMYKKF